MDKDVGFIFWNNNICFYVKFFSEFEIDLFFINVVVDKEIIDLFFLCGCVIFMICGCRGLVDVFFFDGFIIIFKYLCFGDVIECVIDNYFVNW